MAIKPVRPVQPVKALSIEVPETTKNPTTRVISPTVPVNKSEIEIVVTDNIENYKRNKTFRKSLRGSMRRPLSSPAQVRHEFARYNSLFKSNSKDNGSKSSRRHFLASILFILSKLIKFVWYPKIFSNEIPSLRQFGSVCQFEGFFGGVCVGGGWCVWGRCEDRGGCTASRT